MTMTNQTQQDKFIYLPIYLSDYVSDSRKLTMLQRGALIDLSVLYFQENLKINYQKEQLYRLVFAFSKDEQEAVDFILENYFTKSENKPTGFYWVSNRLNQLGDKILKRLNSSRENGKKGGRGKKKENKPIGLNSVNLEPNLDESILNESKLNEIKTKKIKNKLNENNIFKELSNNLQFVLEDKLQRKLSSRNWEDEIKKLIEKDLSVRPNPIEDVKRAIQTIADNYGKNYFPVVQSGSALRQKFTMIENFVKRNTTIQPTQTHDEFSGYFHMMNKDLGGKNGV